MHKASARQARARLANSKALSCAWMDSGNRAGHEILEAIYRQERAGLLRYLKREVGHDLALDIAQEVFLRASRSDQIGRLENPGGFLHRIARNLLIDRARRRKCRISTLPLIEEIDAPCAAQQEQAAEARDLKMALERALTQLPEKTRRIFTMHRFEQMAYREIQRELDISIAAVEYHMMKALAHVRSSLAQTRADCA